MCVCVCMCVRWEGKREKERHPIFNSRGGENVDGKRKKERRGWHAKNVQLIIIYCSKMGALVIETLSLFRRFFAQGNRDSRYRSRYPDIDKLHLKCNCITFCNYFLFVIP